MVITWHNEYDGLGTDNFLTNSLVDKQYRFLKNLIEHFCNTALLINLSVVAAFKFKISLWGWDNKALESTIQPVD